MYDLIIKRGLIFLGREKGWLEGDIALSGDKIAKIAPEITSSREEIIDAGNKIVAPGFIDVHTHDEIELIKNGTVYPKVTQGVTTVIVGNCGLGFYPIDPGRKELLKDYNQAIYDISEIEVDWIDLADFRSKLREKQLGINAGMMVGHGAIRIATMGFASREATPEELKAMGERLKNALNQGALGMSTGLLYPPSSYAGRNEILYLAQILYQQNALYTTHMRNESDQIFDCINENIELSRETGVNTEISHLNLSGKANWGRAGEVLEMLRQARRQKINIHADQYPYRAGSTLITALLPQWALSEGVAYLVDRLKNSPDFCRRIIRDIEKGLPGWDNIIGSTGWENIIINSSPENLSDRYLGASLAEIARQEGKNNYENLLDLIRESKGQLTILIFSTSGEDVRKILADPEVLVGSDGINTGGRPHPRLYGSFPRILGKYVREERVLDLETALYKMTALPAKKFGLADRGLIRPGYKADLVIFDPEEVKDEADYQHSNQTASGIEWVLVNGRGVVWPGGFRSEERPGELF